MSALNELHCFLGVCTYSVQFIDDYAEIAKQLQKLGRILEGTILTANQHTPFTVSAE